MGEELAPHGIYVGTVTIVGYVKSGTYYDPASIADVFYRMYEERKVREVIDQERQ